MSETRVCQQRSIPRVSILFPSPYAASVRLKNDVLFMTLIVYDGKPTSSNKGVGYWSQTIGFGTVCAMHRQLLTSSELPLELGYQVTMVFRGIMCHSVDCLFWNDTFPFFSLFP